MKPQRSLSIQTVRNWTIDALLITSAIAAFLSGVYFLYFISGGYMGGRNPLYGISFIFPRETWEVIHTWGGVVVIAVALVHVVIHWSWVVMMTHRLLIELIGKKPVKRLSRGAWMNIWLNIALGLNFFIASLSGIYFLIFPSGSHGVPDPYLFFSKPVWDVLHLWSGILVILLTMFHFIIHWKWVVKVTQRICSGFSIKKKENERCVIQGTASSVI